MIDRLAPTFRPSGRAAGYQRWSNLLFVHWRVPADDIQRLLPPRLTVDTWDGFAWVGMVLFHMDGVRPWWFPALPRLSSFHETNVRTYVHLDGNRPGIWFFSLEAACSAAVRVARRRWHLPYFRADMRLELVENRVAYQSERLWPGTRGPAVDIEAEIGQPLPGDDASAAGRAAAPGALEHFLAERYILYVEGRGGRLLSAQVHHRPYPLREARLERAEESLLHAAGITPVGGVEHTMFSDGVSVEVFPLAPSEP